LVVQPDPSAECRLDATPPGVTLSPALRRLLRHIECRCFAECCQAAAFELDRIRIESWFHSEPDGRRHEIKAAIVAALVVVEGTPNVFVRLETRSLESTWRRDEFVTFFAELKGVIDC